jgi:alkylhydroperoxidase family enzyme
MYRRQQAAWGYVPNYAKVFSHRPEVMARWGQLLAEIKRPMDVRRFELVTFAVACELRNTACSLAHGHKLREFFNEDEIIEIASAGTTGRLAAAENTMVRFARRVARDASSITQDDVDELRNAGLIDAEVFDVVATAAGRTFFTKVLDALGVQADAALAESAATMRDALTVGRPTASGPCTTMPLEPLNDDA